MGVSLSDVKEVASLVTSVLKLGDIWYNDTPQTLQDLQSLADDSVEKYKSWKKRAKKYGLRRDMVLKSRLQRAKRELQDEETRLKNMNTRFGRLCLCLRLLAGTNVPEQVKQRVIDLNTVILNKWKSEDDADEAAFEQAQQLAAARKSRFSFTRDRMYARLPDIEDKVKALLNEGVRGAEQPAQVVFLHGRAGCGKSSMARHLALDYQQATTIDEEETESDDEEAESNEKGSAFISANGCRRFQCVYFLDCGRTADWKVKQKELLEMLPGAPIKTTPSQITVVADASAKAVMDECLLIQLLENSVCLIIFDDVWEGSFLRKMVGVCGRNMRVLVTSQSPSLSTSLIASTAPLSISMDEISRKDSLRIFMTQMEFSQEKSIHQDVKKCMKNLVDKVDGHPHALASFAAGIDKNHKEEVRLWRHVISKYEKYLEDSSGPDHPLHGVSYERSVFGAIQVKFAELGEKEKLLLILMGILDGSQIPQTMIQFFRQALDFPMIQDQYRFMDTSNGKEISTDFWAARRKLEALRWIKTHYCGGEMAWSIHSLDKSFIQRNFDKDIRTLRSVLRHLDLERIMTQGPREQRSLKVLDELARIFVKEEYVPCDVMTAREFSEGISEDIPERPLEKIVEETLTTQRLSRVEALVKILLQSKLRYREGDPRDNLLVVLVSLLVNDIGTGWSVVSQQSAYGIVLAALQPPRLQPPSRAQELEYSSLVDDIKNLLLKSSLSEVQWFGLLQTFMEFEDSLRRGSPVGRPHKVYEWMNSIVGRFEDTVICTEDCEEAEPLSLEQTKVLVIIQTVHQFSRFDKPSACCRPKIVSRLFKTWTSPRASLVVKCATAACFFQSANFCDVGMSADSREISGLLDYVKEVLASTPMTRKGIEAIPKVIETVTGYNSVKYMRYSYLDLHGHEFCTIEALVGLIVLMFVKACQSHDVIAEGLQIFSRLDPTFEKIK